MTLLRGWNHRATQGCVLTIGNFDGVHRGHQALLNKLAIKAFTHDVPTVAMVFEPTPREYFAPQSAPVRVQTFRDRYQSLRRFGADKVLVYRFDHRLHAMSADAFVRDILVAQMQVKAVVVGDDFRFGAERQGDFELLKLLGQAFDFTADQVGGVSVDGQRCSSTALRSHLSLGEVEAAADLLARRYRITGVVRHGLKLGRKLDMPTANIVLPKPVALRHGVYAVRASCGKQVKNWAGVASWGVRPTLGRAESPLLEVHLLGNPDQLLYGQEMAVDFYQFIRPQAKFDTLEALKTAMHHDLQQVQAFFAQQTNA
jgi:riboflavin kinase/FMN adenylyltransferase